MSSPNKAIVCLLFIFLGCNSQKSAPLETAESEIRSSADSLTTYSIDTPPRYQIDFTRSSVYSFDQDINLLSNIAVDGTGNLYFGDGTSMFSTKTIQVFQQDKQIGSIGRAGKGPGEFQLFSQIKTLADELFILDTFSYRISIFSTSTHALIDEIQLNRDEWQEVDELKNSVVSDYFYPLPDGTLLVGFEERPALDRSNRWEYSETDTIFRFYKIDREGELVSDKILQNEGLSFEMTSPPAPFFRSKHPAERSSLMAVSGEGELYTANTDQFLIDVYDASGNYERSIHYPLENIPFDKSKIDYEFVDILPDTWPVLNTMIIDDENRLWVSTITESDDHYRWWVLNEEGELLSTFTWEGSRYRRGKSDSKILLIENNKLYFHNLNRQDFNQSSLEVYDVQFSSN